MQNKNNEQFKQACQGIDRLIQKTKPQTSTRMKSAVVALFTGDNQNPLRFSGIIGMLHLDNDRILKSKMFRLYEIQSLTLLFQIQMFYGFDENYRMVTEKLYVFDYFTDGVIGFQFYNKQDADIMYIKVKSTAPKISQLREMQKQQLNNRQKNKQKTRFFGNLKKKVKGFLGTAQQQVIQQSSEVFSVQRNKSIKYDMYKGEFMTQNIPFQWQQIFQAMNISKQQLKDKNIAKFIIQQTIIHQSRKYMIENPSQQFKIQLDTIDEEQSMIYDSQISTKVEDKNESFSNQNKNKNMLPIPPSIQNLKPSPLQKVDYRTSRSDLMAQIRNNNLKLRPVKTTEKGYEIDASSMNRQQRMDLAQHLRLKLQRRKAALNRRKAQQQQD